MKSALTPASSDLAGVAPQGLKPSQESAEGHVRHELCSLVPKAILPEIQVVHVREGPLLQRHLEPLDAPLVNVVRPEVKPGDAASRASAEGVE
eukprot:CAMPEP_0182475044 /NCGR_PEP_ID=MMETSP1319-20130603/26712_1 /TAXON_ID=172717 /ORGANISM="Bolidomonas pacifica, Strain RCC208" /LENGTH=92 /DNA_ID=CAMNT_0024675995 /DNA_START=102 /DNA_END=379 /DNA_ORIENTATION=-